MNEYTDPANIPDFIAAEARAGRCQGGCESHTGEVRPVFVERWGWFPYCETATDEDRQRGLVVQVRESA